MSAVFPIGFPQATAFYLTVYVLTFVLHQAFMHYVLAGSLYVAWATISPGRNGVKRIEQPLAATLRDWMPFLLSAAITAGVAPLLFVQIVYQYQFYTANLLLWWRWMLVVPVLIVAFYLLYLIKSSRLWTWPYAIRVTVSAGTSLCFVFVGFCWTANHLLSIIRSTWPEVYATGKLPLIAAMVVPRMLVWIGGSFATMSTILGWQMLYRQVSSDRPLYGSELRTLTGLSGAGLAVALIAGLIYVMQLSGSSRTALLSTAIMPYLVLAVVGLVMQGLGWGLQYRSKVLTRSGLLMTSIGCLVSLTSVAVIREGIRIQAIDLGSLAARHAEAAKVGGFGVFVVAVVVVGAVIVWCIRLVQQGRREFAAGRSSEELQVR